MKKYKILILTAFWQRPNISVAYWMGIQRLKKTFDIKVLSIISDAENETLAEEFSDYIFHYENSPLGKKMNAGLLATLQYDYDFLMQLGSDDLISDLAVAKLCSVYESGVKFFGLKQLLMFDSEKKDCKRYDYANVFGAGRCIAKSIVERLAKSKENIFWDDNKERTLDINSELKIEAMGIVAVPVIFDDPQTVGIKSDVNIWNINHFKHATDYPVEKIKNLISKEEFDHIMGL